MTSTRDFPLPFARPQEVGFSTERLARIGPGLRKYIDEQKVPNLVTLVARHGKVVHYEAQGYMDMEARRPVGKDTIFRLYSNTKPITGVAIMMLYEDGKLGLDDPISKWVPSFKDPRVRVFDPPEGMEANASAAGGVLTVPARREVTVRDCLRHTTGLATPNRASLQYITVYRDVLKALGWYPGSERGPRSVKEHVENIGKLPLSFHPGTEWEYHVGYPVLGYVIEQVVGKPLEEFYQERIFKPLGMKDTSFYIQDGGIARFPACYVPRRAPEGWKTTLMERAEESEKVKGPKTFFGAGGDMGGVLSTVGDYARFGQMLLNGGELDGVRLLGRRTVEVMTSNHTRDLRIPLMGAGAGWGLGVGVRTGPGGPSVYRSIGAYGWGGAAGTNYFADPREGIIAVIFTQVFMHRVMPGLLYVEDFERFVYQALV